MKTAHGFAFKIKYDSRAPHSGHLTQYSPKNAIEILFDGAMRYFGWQFSCIRPDGIFWMAPPRRIHPSRGNFAHL